MRAPFSAKLAATLATSLVLTIAALVPAMAQKAIPLASSANAAGDFLPVVPSRVVERVDDSKLVKLTGNTQPSARPKNDRGLLDPATQLDRIMLVLKRSPEQERALAAFNEHQYDPKSPDFHHWLTATEFGQLYGPSDSDIAQIASWLQNSGFSIFRVSKGRVTIEFSGTVAQVQQAFHLEMHQYMVNGKMHIANDRDPSIPAALFPVVTGILSLHDFFPTRTHRPNLYIKRDLVTGKYSRWKPENETANTTPPETPSSDDPHFYITPDSKGEGKPNGPHSDFVFQDPNVSPSGFPDQVLAPYDVATIYNILPLWKESKPIDGSGVSVAIIGYSDVVDSDFNTFRSSFGLPASTLETVHDGADPGVQTNGSEGENTLDVEMVSSTAPGAQVILVSNVSTSTTDGLAIGINYVVENNIAPILTMSYLSCELNLGTSGNSYYSQIFQQATTSGITPLTCSDDAGSAGCTSQDGTSPYGDSYGLAVSGMTSNPYVTSVGGSDLQWYLGSKPADTYWNSTNNATTGASAKGYMPEMSWNTSCTNPLLIGSSYFPDATSSEQICNSSINANPGLLSMGSGGGGVSACTTNDTTNSTTTLDPSSCSGGFPKPSWQTGVPGLIAGSKRQVPDVVMFGSYGFNQDTTLPLSALLICQANETETGTCNYSNGNYIVYEANGGTSAATPLTAGIMAMVLQKTGTKQGLANPVLYSLAAKEDYSSCNSNTVQPGNSCIFYDITTGSNAMNCYAGGPDCVTNTSGDSAGILSGYSAGVGYDMTTGLGSMNVANLVNAWPTASGAPAVTLTPTSLSFPSTAVGVTSAGQAITVKNTGNATLTISNIEITGTNYTSFNGTSTCNTSLAAGATCTITVTFEPTAAGTLTASILLSDNAGSGSQTAALSGIGGTATTLSGTLSPTSIAFPTTTVGATSAAQVVTFTNTGSSAISVASYTFTGADASSFVLTAHTCGTSLAAGASCTLTVAFKPAASGALTATLNANDNIPGSPQKVTLTGTGGATALAGKLSPTSIAFPATAVGATSAAQVVTFTNTGSSAISVTSYTFTGTDASSFVLTAHTCGTSLAAGASCTLAVAFKPTASGSLTATLNANDNIPGSPQTVALSGTGGSAALAGTLSPASIAFPTTAVGSTSATQVVTFKNTGSSAIAVNSYTFAGTDASSFVLTAHTCGTSLASGASCTLTVAFKPAASGALTATLDANDNIPGSPQKVTLTGTGGSSSSSTVKLSPTGVAFPATIVGATSDDQIVTLTNSGSTRVTINSITLAGANPTDFEQLTDCAATLAASASCSIYVAFKPATAAALTATLSVADSASGSPQTAALSGTGTAAPSVKLSTTGIAFPTTAHGTTSDAQAVILTNAGTATLNLTSIAITGTNPTDFIALNTCGPTLAPSANCTVYVAFAPAAAAAYKATLTIADNGSASPQSVALSGNGD